MERPRKAAIVSCHPVATARPTRPASTKNTRQPIKIRSRKRLECVAVLEARGGGERLLISIGCRLATDLGDNVMLFRFHKQFLRENRTKCAHRVAQTLNASVQLGFLAHCAFTNGQKAMNFGSSDPALHTSISTGSRRAPHSVKCIWHGCVVCNHKRRGRDSVDQFRFDAAMRPEITALRTVITLADFACRQTMVASVAERMSSWLTPSAHSRM